MQVNETLLKQIVKKFLPQLLPDWKLILRKSWSVKLMALAACFSGAEAALPYLEGITIWGHSLPTGVFAALSATTVSAAFVARFFAQQAIQKERDNAKDR